MIPVRRFGLAALSLILVASCGSGSSKSTTPSTQTPSSTAAPPTKAAYIATVNALCQTMNTRVNALANPGSDPIKQADANDQAIAITTETLRKLRAVPEPAGASAALAAIFAKVDTVLADAKALSVALRARDQTAALAAGRKASASSDAANKASNDFGLTVCGS